MAGGLDRGTCAGSVEALLVVGGEAYAGGYFFAPDSTLSIARWDGSWHSVGGGVSGSLQQVYALAGINGELFVGVAFDHAGGAAGFNYIATWNGVAWSALGSGLNNFVYALATKGTRVYVGGRFTTAGGVSANRIAY